MARSTLGGSLVVALVGGLVGVGSGAPAEAPVPRAVPGPPADKDITAEARDWNSAEFAAPPDKVRPGHVTPR